MAAIAAVTAAIVAAVLGLPRLRGSKESAREQLAAAGFGGGSSLPAAAAPTGPALPGRDWLTDIGEGISTARAEQKDMLVEFTSGEVAASPLEACFHDPSFASAADAWGFVRVRLNATTSEASPASVMRTAEWIERLDLKDLPVAVAFDAAGHPFGLLRPAAASPAGLAAGLPALAAAQRQRDAALAAAAREQGVGHAKRLDEALAAVGAAAPGYPDLMEEIVKGDADGSAGLKAKYAARVSEHLIDSTIQQVVYPMIDGGGIQPAIAQIERLDQTVATSSAQHQMLKAFSAQLHAQAGEKSLAVSMMDDAIRLDPASEAAAKIRGEKQKLVE